MELLAVAALIIIAASLALSSMKRFELAILLVLCNIIIFIFQLAAGGINLSTSISQLAFNPEYLHTGENLYTIITSMFAHASIAHLLGNMLFLILLGPALEARVGKIWFAISYFIGGLAGTLFWTAQMWDVNVFLLGASGAISGIIGSLLVAYPREKIMMIVGFIFLPNASVWLVTAAWFVFNVLLAVGSSDTAWQAHLGGFLAGMVIGLVMRHSVSNPEKTKAPQLESLEELVTNRQQQEALDALKDETNPDLINAWMEHFAKNTSCPKCGNAMQWTRGGLKCNCGYTRKIK